ncbi:hypothetical protein [Sphaerospermopsis sp. LEGE 00249]|nr:hypothetical protein [Sphaerospermopsis sp. LEGE 00249]
MLSVNDLRSLIAGDWVINFPFFPSPQSPITNYEVIQKNIK